MPLRVGKVLSVEEPPGSKKAILRVTLRNGMRVYVPASLIAEPFDPEGEYIFVERGPLGRTEWYGTWEQMPDAVRTGIISSAEAQSMGYTADGHVDITDADAVVRMQRTYMEGKPPNEAASSAGCMSVIGGVAVLAIVYRLRSRPPGR